MLWFSHTSLRFSKSISIGTFSLKPHFFAQTHFIYITIKKISVYSSSSFTNNNKKLGILQKYIFHRSSLFFYDNTIFHLLIASKITPKSIDIISIFLSVFFSIGNKESALNGYSLACPFILSDIFPNYNNLRAYSCYCTSS